MRDLNALSDAVISTVKGYVSRSAELLSARLDGFEKRLIDFVALQPDVEAVVERQVADAVSRIPRPEDGKSVTLDEVMPAICDAIKNVVSTIRIPEDGKPGKDGKSIDEEHVKTVIEGIKKDAESRVSEAISAIPVPENGEDGKSVTPEQIEAITSDITQKAELKIAELVAAIPKPKNGQDVDPEAVRAIAAEEVAKAVEKIEIPAPGPTEKDIESMLDAKVSKAFEAIRVPEDGKSVPVEDVQRMIDDAVAKAISGIRLPKDGDPGRDASQIEILPAIDETKAYPRSTYAKHAGGLWRSFETTSGMKGWECIVEGVKSLDISMPSERQGVIKIESSSGATETKSFTIPAMIYQGVFREGESYAHGDTATWGGSLWHCNADTTDKPGDASKAWTLCAKKGRDGSDGKPVLVAGKK